MNTKSGKIFFQNFVGFPSLEDDAFIPTEIFLKGAEEIVSVIESFGKIFYPVVSDMAGNIRKLSDSYQTNTEKFFYLDDLISYEKQNQKKFAIISLLWLKRALELIAIFFENILKDKKSSENLTFAFSTAYEESLKPYHNWFVQKSFVVILNWIPTRSQLIGTGEQYDLNLKALNVFLPNMQIYLKKINVLLNGCNLD